MTPSELAPGEVGFSVAALSISAIIIAVLVYLITRTIVKVADKPPALALTIVLATIVVLLIVMGLTLESDQALELAGVGIGALAGAVTATWRPDDDHFPDVQPEPDTEAPDLTEPVPDSTGVPPENQVVPDEIEELGK